MAANEGGYAATAARAGVTSRRPSTSTRDDGADGRGCRRGRVPGVAALVVTHLHGDAVPMAGSGALVRERGIALVEDCAQAHGLGSMADTSAPRRTPPPSASTRRRTSPPWETVAPWPSATRPPPPGTEPSSVRLGGALPGRVRRGPQLPPGHPAGRRARRAPGSSGRRNARRRSIADRYGVGLLRIHGDPVSTVAHHAVVVTEQRDRRATHLAAAAASRRRCTTPTCCRRCPGSRSAPTVTPGATGLRDRILSLPCFPEMSDDEAEPGATPLSDWVGGMTRWAAESAPSLRTWTGAGRSSRSSSTTWASRYAGSSP